MYICIGFQRQAFSTMVPMWKAHSSSRRTVAGTFYLGSLLPQVIYKWYMHLTVHVCIYTIDRKSKHAVHPSVHVLHNIVMFSVHSVLAFKTLYTSFYIQSGAGQNLLGGVGSGFEHCPHCESALLEVCQETNESRTGAKELTHRAKEVYVSLLC